MYEGVPGVAAVVDDPANLFLVENLILIDDNESEYDGATWSVADGEYIRMHPLHVGEEILVDEVEGDITTLAIGDTLKAAATGKLTK